MPQLELIKSFIKGFLLESGTKLSTFPALPAGISSMATTASCGDRQRSSGPLVLSISIVLIYAVWGRERGTEWVCVVRKADSWGQPCSKQAASRDAVVPLRSCRHGSVTKGATVWLWRLAPGIRYPLHSQFIPSFPLHVPQEKAVVSLCFPVLWACIRKQKEWEFLLSFFDTVIEVLIQLYVLALRS